MSSTLDRLWINYPYILSSLSPWKLIPILENHSMPILWQNHLHFPINWPLIIVIRRLELGYYREILLVWDLKSLSSNVMLLDWCAIGVMRVWTKLDEWHEIEPHLCNFSFYQSMKLFVPFPILFSISMMNVCSNVVNSICL